MSNSVVPPGKGYKAVLMELGSTKKVGAESHQNALGAGTHLWTSRGTNVNIRNIGASGYWLKHFVVNFVEEKNSPKILGRGCFFACTQKKHTRGGTKSVPNHCGAFWGGLIMVGVGGNIEVGIKSCVSISMGKKNHVRPILQQLNVERPEAAQREGS